MKRPERVAVIGVGILGAGVGRNLSGYGAKEVFIDAGQPGEGVTNWSFSWVNASSKTVRKSSFDLIRTARAHLAADRGWSGAFPLFGATAQLARLFSVARLSAPGGPSAP